MNSGTLSYKKLDRTQVASSTPETTLVYSFGRGIRFDGHFAHTVVPRALSFLEQERTEVEFLDHFASIVDAEKAKSILYQLVSAGLAYKVTGGAFTGTARESYVHLTTSLNQRHQIADQTPSIDAELDAIKNKTSFFFNFSSLRFSPENIQEANSLCSIEIATSPVSTSVESYTLIGALIDDRHVSTDTIQDFNRSMLMQRKSWLPVIVDPFGASIGPLLGTAGGPCLQCLDATRSPSEQTSIGHSVPHCSILSFVAVEVARVFSHLSRPRILSTTLEIDLFNRQTSWRQPHWQLFCPECRPPNVHNREILGLR